MVFSGNTYVQDFSIHASGRRVNLIVAKLDRVVYTYKKIFILERREREESLIKNNFTKTMHKVLMHVRKRESKTNVDLPRYKVYTISTD
jgi:hypothetical protein